MNRYTVEIEGTTYEVNLLDRRPDGLSFELNGELYAVRVSAQPSGTHAAISAAPSMLRASEPAQSGKARDGNLYAPMPGIIAKILVVQGDKIEAGQALIVLEAMKMENHINAPRSGLVKEIHVSIGSEVAGGVLLITIAD